MKYAPIIVPTLCRDELFIKCIESLKKNPWAKYTDVYIGLDYPLKPSHEDGYARICDYLEGEFEEFASFKVYKRSQNVGEKKNLELILDEIQSEHDCWITLEDDIECSPNFIEYMDKMLELYEDDESVIAVTGYAYPVEWVTSGHANVVKQNFTANTWGIGKWRLKSTKTDCYIHQYGLYKDFFKQYKAGLPNMIDWAKKDYISMSIGKISPHSYIMRATDIAQRLVLATQCKYVIMPLVSKTRNNGKDGSGINERAMEFDPNQPFTSTNYEFDKQPIDTERYFIPIVDENFDMQENCRRLNEFDKVDQGSLKKLMDLAERKTRYKLLWDINLSIRILISKIYGKIKG